MTNYFNSAKQVTTSNDAIASLVEFSIKQKKQNAKVLCSQHYHFRSVQKQTDSTWFP